MNAKKELKRFLKRNAPKLKEIEHDLASTASVIAEGVKKEGKKIAKKAEAKGKAVIKKGKKIAKKAEAKGKSIVKKVEKKGKKLGGLYGSKKTRTISR